MEETCQGCNNYYIKEPFNRPNTELLELLEFNHEFVNLSDDGRFSMLKYPYIHGDHIRIK